ncbi:MULTISPECIES: hypothetical protein [Corallococcus]|uniref:hypothetical protein n=1 Tax=Corallococcus TaxID=83461 RepID=UPI0011E60451|nr:MULTISPECIES: hypothetical protein [Corallococcus]NRD55548.1 hypothetical protein [Corallococcus exiguus]
MHEVEHKSVVDDLLLRRGHVEGAGGRLRFEGTMVDRYYTLDTRPDSGAGRLWVRRNPAPHCTSQDDCYSGATCTGNTCRPVCDFSNLPVERSSSSRDLSYTGCPKAQYCCMGYCIPFVPARHWTRRPVQNATPAATR